MKLDRSSGVLMHITSLPGKYGIGTLGAEAYWFADMISHAGQTYWQVLPFNPVNPMFGYSPYISFSTFAGNPFFISIEKLREKQWLPDDIILDSEFDQYSHFVNYENVTTLSEKILSKVFSIFKDTSPEVELSNYEEFCSENSFWLDDFALYASLAKHFKTYLWTEWDQDISQRESEAMKKWSENLSDDMDYNKFVQYLFFSQWKCWKDHCNHRGINIIGDMPMYINFDSCDAWVNPEIFQIYKESDKIKPEFVAGIPPDYFSATGHRWGNPLYRWFDNKGNLDKNTSGWWLNRIKHLNKHVDVIRLGHFKAFESYWSIPEKEENGINGKWVKGPGGAFFDLVKESLGDIDFIVEDLGVITPEVEKLRDEKSLPGMKILQFAFDYKNDNKYLPHNFNNHNAVLYTGTHDNNTTNGWYYGDELDDHGRNFIKKYMNIESDSDFHWHFIHFAYSSLAKLVIIPAQDILGYDSTFRMNRPGVKEGNWGWKLTPGALNEWHLNRLRDLCWLFKRARK